MMPTDTAARWSMIGCALIGARRDLAAERVVQRDPGAGDRRGAGAAVGLQHVAVDQHLALAERHHVGHRCGATGR